VSPTPRSVRFALAAALAAASAAAWLGYQRPGFLVWLANASWLCT
jgi:hypothetical protein